MAKPNKNNKQTVSWAQAFRDIIIRAMDRGQLLPVLAFLLFLAFIWKMPEEKVYDFGVLILDGFKTLSLVGWGLSGVVCILWAGHARIMRRKHSSEYLRIGREKSRLQQEQVNAQIGSSDNY
ncbi:hypothetical protein A6D98_19370 [Aliivibrio fischeri]|uniref:hypothetical protein n=1 Tax=Aliivibrio fischeri TaxID=668 RepID=UPI00080DE652|nr:hypothetical protein [Aliivibrio fischeri]OCH57562.1 hypothetical protein A6D98_19370 [Aliivibrio fischeri]